MATTSFEQLRQSLAMELGWLSSQRAPLSIMGQHIGEIADTLRMHGADESLESFLACDDYDVSKLAEQLEYCVEANLTMLPLLSACMALLERHDIDATSRINRVAGGAATKCGLSWRECMSAGDLAALIGDWVTNVYRELGSDSEAPLDGPALTRCFLTCLTATALAESLSTTWLAAMANRLYAQLLLHIDLRGSLVAHHLELAIAFAENSSDQLAHDFAEELRILCLHHCLESLDAEDAAFTLSALFCSFARLSEANRSTFAGTVLGRFRLSILGAQDAHRLRELGSLVLSLDSTWFDSTAPRDATWTYAALFCMQLADDVAKDESSSNRNVAQMLDFLCVVQVICRECGSSEILESVLVQRRRQLTILCMSRIQRAQVQLPRAVEAAAQSDDSEVVSICAKIETSFESLPAFRGWQADLAFALRVFRLLAAVRRVDLAAISVAIDQSRNVIHQLDLTDDGDNEQAEIVKSLRQATRMILLGGVLQLDLPRALSFSGQGLLNGDTQSGYTFVIMRVISMIIDDEVIRDQVPVGLRSLLATLYEGMKVVRAGAPDRLEEVVRNLQLPSEIADTSLASLTSFFCHAMGTGFVKSAAGKPADAADLLRTVVYGPWPLPSGETAADQIVRAAPIFNRFWHQATGELVRVLCKAGDPDELLEFVRVVGPNAGSALSIEFDGELGGWVLVRAFGSACRGVARCLRGSSDSQRRTLLDEMLQADGCWKSALRGEPTYLEAILRLAKGVDDAVYNDTLNAGLDVIEKAIEAQDITQVEDGASLAAELCDMVPQSETSALRFARSGLELVRLYVAALDLTVDEVAESALTLGVHKFIRRFLAWSFMRQDSDAVLEIAAAAQGRYALASTLRYGATDSTVGGAQVEQILALRQTVRAAKARRAGLSPEISWGPSIEVASPLRESQIEVALALSRYKDLREDVKRSGREFEVFGVPDLRLVGSILSEGRPNICLTLLCPLRHPETGTLPSTGVIQIRFGAEPTLWVVEPGVDAHSKYLLGYFNYLVTGGGQLQPATLRGSQSIDLEPSDAAVKNARDLDGDDDNEIDGDTLRGPREFAIADSVRQVNEAHAREVWQSISERRLIDETTIAVPVWELAATPWERIGDEVGMTSIHIFQGLAAALHSVRSKWIDRDLSFERARGSANVSLDEFDVDRRRHHPTMSVIPGVHSDALIATKILDATVLASWPLPASCMWLFLCHGDAYRLFTGGRTKPVDANELFQQMSAESSAPEAIVMMACGAGSGRLDGFMECGGFPALSNLVVPIVVAATEPISDEYASLYLSVLLHSWREVGSLRTAIRDVRRRFRSGDWFSECRSCDALHLLEDAAVESLMRQPSRLGVPTEVLRKLAAKKIERWWQRRREFLDQHPQMKRLVGSISLFG